MLIKMKIKGNERFLSLSYVMIECSLRNSVDGGRQPNVRERLFNFLLTMMLKFSLWKRISDRAYGPNLSCSTMNFLSHIIIKKATNYDGLSNPV